MCLYNCSSASPGPASKGGGLWAHVPGSVVLHPKVQQEQISFMTWEDISETASRTGQVMHSFPPCPSQEQAELKLWGCELRAKEE